MCSFHNCCRIVTLNFSTTLLSSVVVVIIQESRTRIQSRTNAEVASAEVAFCLQGLLFHLYDTRKHISSTTCQKLRVLEWKVLMHPPYNPDLQLSDCNIFRFMVWKIHGREKKRVLIWFNRPYESGQMKIFSKNQNSFEKQRCLIFLNRWILNLFDNCANKRNYFNYNLIIITLFIVYKTVQFVF